MEKRFKCIKAYPGGPQLGAIIKEDFEPKCGLYPEFWEEIKEEEEEKNYEILSYYCPSLSSRGYHIQQASCFIDPQFGGNSEWKIYSVKRLIDDLIFTIGDNLANDKKIVSISLIEGKIRIYPKNSFYKLEEAVKEKISPLFISEDGVKIYEEDSFYRVGMVNNNSNYFICWDKATGTKASKDYLYAFMNRSHYHFSSVEAADKFIIMNKPCLSVNDVMNVSYYGIVNSKSLEEIVKSRING